AVGDDVARDRHGDAARLGRDADRMIGAWDFRCAFRHGAILTPPASYRDEIEPSIHGCPGSPATRASSMSGSAGLVRCWSNPAASALRLSSARPQPVTATK